MSKYKNLMRCGKGALVVLGTAAVLLETATIYHNYAEIEDLNGDGQKEFVIKIDDLRIGWTNHDKCFSDYIPTISRISNNSLDTKLK